jgi:hypothetical protein
MKKIPVFFFSAFCALTAHATIHTVSNDPTNAAQFTTVQAAISASSAGDTIYVNPSQYVYPDFTINKRLVIIGGGYNSNNQFNLITVVGSVYFYRDAGIFDASGSVICGFRISNSISGAGGTLSVNSLKIFRNSISTIDSYPTSVSGWTIYNNFIGAINGRSSCTNFLIQNNIFVGGGIGSFNQSSVVIDHNLFVNGGAFNNIQFAIITNNIITSSSGTQVMASNVVQNTFNNNLSLSTNITPAAPTNSFLAGPNTGGGNMVGVDPLFVSNSDFNNFNNNYNYRLQVGSPGHNAATDGTDLGIYGGTYPFPSGGAPGSGYDTSPLPPIPQITSVNIQNSSVLPGNQLKVNVQATVNN